MYTEEGMLARYNDLCARRDAVYAKQKPLEEALAKANAECEAARIKAASLAAEIDKEFGQDWFALKKEIALLARNLGKPNGPLAS
jgi:hypothetical protein